MRVLEALSGMYLLDGRKRFTMDTETKEWGSAHWGKVLISGTTTPINPSLDSAPLTIPAGIITYWVESL